MAKFEEVLPEGRKGKVIYRSIWRPKDGIELDEISGFFCERLGAIAYVGAEDLVADDWKVWDGISPTSLSAQGERKNRDGT